MNRTPANHRLHARVGVRPLESVEARRARVTRLVLPLLAAAVLATALLTARTAEAQYVGPSSLTATDVRTLIEQGKDDQHAVLRGRIVSHDGGDNYTFEDGTGRIAIEASSRRFPAGRPVSEKDSVELSGKLDRDRKGIEFDVDTLRLL